MWSVHRNVGLHDNHFLKDSCSSCSLKQKELRKPEFRRQWSVSIMMLLQSLHSPLYSFCVILSCQTLSQEVVLIKNSVKNLCCSPVVLIQCCPFWTAKAGKSKETFALTTILEKSTNFDLKHVLKGPLTNSLGVHRLRSIRIYILNMLDIITMKKSLCHNRTFQK